MYTADGKRRWTHEGDVGGVEMALVPGLILVMAMALIQMLNLSRIVANLKPNSKYLDEFEKSWLMLADIYISVFLQMIIRHTKPSFYPFCFDV